MDGVGEGGGIIVAEEVGEGVGNEDGVTSRNSIAGGGVGADWQPPDHKTQNTIK